MAAGAWVSICMGLNSGDASLAEMAGIVAESVSEGCWLANSSFLPRDALLALSASARMAGKFSLSSPLLKARMEGLLLELCAC